MPEVLFPALSQLATQLPLFLVYAAGMVFALVFWRRGPIACLLTLLACAVLFLLAIVQTFATQYLLRTRLDLEGDTVRIGTMMTAIGVIAGFLRAVGIGMLIAAVFVGRRAPVWTGPPPEAQLPEP
ncbi:MAG: hypothetical protein JNM56_09895 [Planctomycetia bacterium]|nr:hypothetical protein [Planctomycetia bacterium]